MRVWHFTTNYHEMRSHAGSWLNVLEQGRGTFFSALDRFDIYNIIREPYKKINSFVVETER